MAKNQKFSILIICALLLSCANQQSPGGGEIDKIPPGIIEFTPGNGTVNYTEDYFEISFSEYVDKRSAQEAIFVSPNVARGFEYDWSGRTLRVYFKEKLKENTTYTITIGTGVADVNNQNKMIQPLLFAFSTGDKIDNGELSGKVYSDKSDDIMIYAYSSQNKFDFSNDKPDYISQVGLDGSYKLLGLRADTYRVLAVRDKLQDLMIDLDTDEFGIQFKNVVLDTVFNIIENVDFFITKLDTIAPKITQAFMKDRNHLFIEFNEPVDSSKINIENFYLYDSTSNKRISPKYFYKSDQKQNQYILAISDSFEGGRTYYCHAENIPDINNNINKKESIDFLPKLDPDTLGIKIESIAGTLPDKKIDYIDAQFLIKFNDGVNTDSVREAINIFDEKNTRLEFESFKKDDANYLFKIKNRLKQNSGYTVKVDASLLMDAAGNMVDTVYTNKISTSNELEYSGVSGAIDSGDEDEMVILNNVNTKEILYTQKVTSQKKFNFGKILPGKYILWVFKDKNNNGKYDFGTITPFKYSEEFTFYPDTIKALARWPVGDILLKKKK
jgi:uncharacterized protein (DUF2141 family)